MINYETIKSVYDDKLTLMQWLNKVQEALKDATAVSFDVNKRGDATLTFSIVFDDGTELETDPIVLEQGESVESATLRNGHLILTLTNGDELDAGNMGAVSGFFINGAQHLIVQYQDGTTNDLGAIFNGSISINGNISATGNILGNIPVLICSGDEIEAQKPVVEVMAGYSFEEGSAGANYSFNTIYAGAVKNGNKLTFVLFTAVTLLASVPGNELAGTFTFPSSIGEKLNPYTLSGQDFLDIKIVNGYVNADTYVQSDARTIKISNTQMRMLFKLNNMTAGNTYLLRNEVTFLLSDNLAE